MSDIRWVYLPYCLVKEGDKYVVLNRDYKPLGQHEAGWVEYEPHAVTIKRLTPEVMRRIDHRGCASSDGTIYLYDDVCSPAQGADCMMSYFARLAVLMDLECSP